MKLETCVKERVYTQQQTLFNDMVLHRQTNIHFCPYELPSTEFNNSHVFFFIYSIISIATLGFF